MIGIKKQWVMTVNGEEINYDEISELRIIDEAGLSLPTLEMNINTTDENKVQKFTQPGYIIEIGLGKDSIEEKMNFQVFKKIATPSADGEGMWFLKIWGILNQLKYLDEQRTVTYLSTDDPKKSNEVWDEVVYRYNFKSDTTTFKDKMLWIQYNISDRKFLDEVVWHGFYDNDDPCLSTLRRDGVARYLPLSKLKTSKGIISNRDGYDFPSNAFEMSQNDGLLSVWGGAERVTPLHSLEEGTNDTVEKLKKESVKVSQQIFKTGIRTENKRYTEYQFMNDNVHSNWWRAYEQNRILKSSLGALQLEFHFDVYHPIYPLDYFEVQWKKQMDNKKPMVIPVGGYWIAIYSEIIMAQGQYQQKIKVAREQLMDS